MSELYECGNMPRPAEHLFMVAALRCNRLACGASNASNFLCIPFNLRTDCHPRLSCCNGVNYDGSIFRVVFTTVARQAAPPRSLAKTANQACSPSFASGIYKETLGIFPKQRFPQALASNALNPLSMLIASSARCKCPLLGTTADTAKSRSPHHHGSPNKQSAHSLKYWG